MLDGHKKLFAEANLENKQDVKNPFVAAYLKTMAKEASQVGQGISPESLTVLRTRFILEWFDKEAGKFPFRLF